MSCLGSNDERNCWFGWQGKPSEEVKIASSASHGTLDESRQRCLALQAAGTRYDATYW